MSGGNTIRSITAQGEIAKIVNDLKKHGLRESDFSSVQMEDGGLPGDYPGLLIKTSAEVAKRLRDSLSKKGPKLNIRALSERYDYLIVIKNTPPDFVLSGENFSVLDRNQTRTKKRGAYKREKRAKVSEKVLRAADAFWRYVENITSIPRDQFKKVYGPNKFLSSGFYLKTEKFPLRKIFIKAAQEYGLRVFQVSGKAGQINVLLEKGGSGLALIDEITDSWAGLLARVAPATSPLRDRLGRIFTHLDAERLRTDGSGDFHHPDFRLTREDVMRLIEGEGFDDEDRSLSSYLERPVWPDILGGWKKIIGMVSFVVQKDVFGEPYGLFFIFSTDGRTKCRVVLRIKPGSQAENVLLPRGIWDEKSDQQTLFAGTYDEAWGVLEKLLAKPRR